MTTLSIDGAVLKQLCLPGTVVEVLDSFGNVAGYFVPKDDAQETGPTISEDEIQRRIDEGGGRSLDEIVRDWMH